MSPKPFTKASSALKANPATVRAVNRYLERKRSSIENRQDGRFFDRMERRLARRVRERWSKQVSYLLTELKEFDFFKEDGKSVRIMTKAQFNNNFKLLMDNMPEREGLVDDIEEHAKITILRGGRTSARRVNNSLGRLKGIRGESKSITVSFDLRNRETTRYLSELRVLHLSNYRGSIDKTTRDGVLNVIKRGVDDGVAYTEMAKRIRDQVDSGLFSKARAEMIAVNQMAKAYEHGNSLPPLEASQLTGEEMFKSWNTVGDDNVTVQCQANENEQWIPMLEGFASGDAHAPRGSHPRCRCSTLYEFESSLAQQGIIDARNLTNENATR